MKISLKKLSVLGLTALLAVSCGQTGENQWTTEIQVNGSKKGDKIAASYLRQFGLSTANADTTVTLTSDNQKITFSSPYVEPSVVMLMYTSQDTLVQPFYFEVFVNKAGEHLKIATDVADFGKTQTTGGMYDEPSYDTLRTLTERFMTLQSQYTDAMTASDMEKMGVLSAQMSQVQKEYFASAMNYVKNNPTKGYSAYLLLNMLPAIPADSSQAIFDNFSDELKKTSFGLDISAQLSKVLRKGSDAPAFFLKDTKGKDISLAEYRGKWVLVDFWGSWCGPCRKGNPGLVKLYNQYKGKGFEIIGLAVNDKEENLLKAIKEDKITWRNVNLSQSNEADVVPMMYNISSVPTKFLIDPEGKIDLIAKGYHPDGEDPLAERLAEIFK